MTTTNENSGQKSRGQQQNAVQGSTSKSSKIQTISLFSNEMTDLDMAFDGYFDKVADLRNGDLTFVPTESITRKNKLQSSSVDVAAHIRSSILSAYQADVEADM